METVCICCPIGCRLKIEEINGEVVVSGNSCPRGKAYGITEYTAPKRVLTTSVVFNGVTYTLKTSDAILKEKLFDAIKEIKKLKSINANIGDVVITNLLSLGVDVIVTGKLEKV